MPAGTSRRAAAVTSWRALKDAGADEIPIVLLVDQGEGLVAVGVRRERGELVGVS